MAQCSSLGSVRARRTRRSGALAIAIVGVSAGCTPDGRARQAIRLVEGVSVRSVRGEVPIRVDDVGRSTDRLDPIRSVVGIGGGNGALGLVQAVADRVVGKA